MSDDKTLFATQPEARDFLKNTSRRKNGDMLFAKLEKSVEFLVKSWEWYTPEGKDRQIALVLGLPDGREFLWPLGSTANYRIGELGYSGPDDIISKMIIVEAYATGSGDQYDPAKRIVGIDEDPDLADWEITERN